MLSDEIIKSKLITFISKSYLDDGEKITETTALTDLNILDSSSIFDVVDYVMNEFNTKMPLEEIHAENFKDVDSLCETIVKLQGVEA